MLEDMKPKGSNVPRSKNDGKWDDEIAMAFKNGEKAFCQMFRLTKEEVRQMYKRKVEPSFFREFLIFFSDVKSAYAKDSPELEPHIMRVAFQTCTRVGREYLQMKSIHEAF